VEQDARLEGVRGAIDEVTKKQQHEHRMVSRLWEEVRGQISQTKKAVGW
jgi:hypothetical protein